MAQALEASKPAHSLSLAIAGSGGAGVMTAGNMLLEAAARAGLYGLMVRISGPQIRGGEAGALLRFAPQPVESLDDHFDVLIALDWQGVQRLAPEIPLGPHRLIIVDPAQGTPPEDYVRGAARCVELAMKNLSKSIPGSWPNMIALGIAAALLGLPAEAVDAVVKESLKGTSSGSLAASLAAVAAGRAAASDIRAPFTLARSAQSAPRWLITGNEAAGLGAIRGGVRFVAAYPITPATEILEWMAPALAQVGGLLVQAEDELASINMAIGASYGGVPALTATAGPGLSLMTEALGLAVAAEVPVVVVDVMRGGPSTGIPAKTEQSDISIALNGLHGDAPRVVLAPNSIADCIVTTQWAVHLAESLQVPVLVLSDQFMGQSCAVIDASPAVSFTGARLSAAAGTENYRRYADSPSGVSPMAIPGTAGLAYTADGLEHDEFGIPSSQAAHHHAQLAKRSRKLAQADYGALWADIEGDGDIAVITLGSSTGPVREAIAAARNRGVPARMISIRLLAPARPAEFDRALNGARRVLVVEQNSGAQLYRYLRSQYDMPGDAKSFARPGPLAIRPSEVCRAITQWGNS
jgi:2-oxoglutarate ferredoxin oxidoreductase subunit alpha